MATPDGPPTPGRNRLLARLSPQEARRLLPHLKPVSLEFRQVLYEVGAPIQFIYFPLFGVVSWLTVMEDGSSVEVATVGNEGLVGLLVILGTETMPWRVMVQVPGQALRMKAAVLKAEAKRGGFLAQLLNRYHNAFLIQITQSVACNLLHSLEKRCCRWLLMTYDRVQSDQIPLTHEFLADMLGVRRASVTEVARKLQRAGLIRYTHGKITILNRPGLEAASCECYRVVKKKFDSLLG